MTEHDETTTRRRGLSRRPAMTLALTLALIAAGCGAPAGPDTGPADGTPETTGAETTTAPDGVPAQTAPLPAGATGPGTAGSGPGGEPCRAYDWAEQAAQEALDKLDRWDDPQPPRWGDFQGAGIHIRRAQSDHDDGDCPPPGPLAAELVERLDLAAQETAADSAAEAEAVDAACADIPPAYLDDTCPGYTPADNPETADPGAGDNPEPAPSTAGPGDTPTGTLPPPEPAPSDDFDDEAPDVPETTAAPQQTGQINLGVPVNLGTLGALLCPPEEIWAGYASCGDSRTPGDYLHGNVSSDICVHPAARFGVGDTYRWESEPFFLDEPLEDGRLGIQVILTGEILGFAAPVYWDASEWWGWVSLRVSETLTRHYTMADGSTRDETFDGYPATHTPSRRMAVGGGPDNRGVNADGTLAWGLMAFQPAAAGWGAAVPNPAETC